MNDKKYLEIIENQISKLEAIQENYKRNPKIVIECSNSIRECVDLIRTINFKLKKW